MPRAGHISPWGTSQPAPVFRPTLEEFEDPMRYIASISSVGKRFGICKVIPPANCPTWKGPNGLPRTINPDKLAFRTKTQMIHQLKHRASRAQVFEQLYSAWKEAAGIEDNGVEPAIDGLFVDLWDLLRSVVKRFGPLSPGCDRMALVNDGGWLEVLNEYINISVLSGSAMARKWGARIDFIGDPVREGEFAVRAAKLRGLYYAHLHAYEQAAVNAPRSQMWTGISEEEIVQFGYGTGDVQTLTHFQNAAAEFKRKHGLDVCSEDELERLYWRIVENAESRVEVDYGNDLSVVQYGSGFPADPSDPMSRHPWNLNVLPKLPNSLFHHTREIIHGVTDPMLYFGMCFTSFAWHVEDQFLYSINYHHTGAPKIWYGVGSDNADGLERVMKNELPELFEKHPDLMHQLVTSITPADLRRSNIPVCKTLQHAGEFVVTFPRGYHCGFNAGFNLAEAVNFAMPDWIAAGVNAIANYKITRRSSAFSHLELMLACARSFPVTQVALHLLQEMYRIIKEYDEMRHAAYARGVGLFMRGQETSKLVSCSVCLTDCYLASVKCGCEGYKQACLSCVNEVSWCRGDCKGKFIVERVPMTVLDSLVKKLEARLQLPKLCLLRGCSECAPAALKSNHKPRVLKPLSDPKSKRVLSSVQRLARRGGQKEKMECLKKVFVVFF